MNQEENMFCYYLGKKYPLVLEIDNSINKTIIEWKDQQLRLRTSVNIDDDYNVALKSFYVKEARKLINARLKLYQSQFKVKYKKVTIEDSKTKWGSCSSQRNLMFNWNLMIFPIEVIDYVVVHELCHLIHLNHDRSFWRLLGKHYPNYKEAMAILGTEKTRDV